MHIVQNRLVCHVYLVVALFIVRYWASRFQHKLKKLCFRNVSGGASRLQIAHRITEAVTLVCIYQSKLLFKTEERKGLKRLRQAKKRNYT